MHNRLIRNSLILLIVLLFVISMKGKLVNGLFAIWVGAWVMSKLFNPMFGPHQGFENLTVNTFIPGFRSSLATTVIHNLSLILENKKLALFVWLWWLSGILTAFLTYQILKIFVIPS